MRGLKELPPHGAWLTEATNPIAAPRDIKRDNSNTHKRRRRRDCLIFAFVFHHVTVTRSHICEVTQFLSMADLSQFGILAVLVVFVLITWRDLTGVADAQPKPHKNIPEPKMAAFAGPTVKFMFW